MTTKKDSTQKRLFAECFGTLALVATVVGSGIMAEMAYTGRKVMGAEAKEIGLVNRVFADKDSMMNSVNEIAATIAAKSPVVVRGTKQMLLYTRDHSVSESLEYMAIWNAAMLISNDLMEAFQSSIERRPPVFED